MRRAAAGAIVLAMAVAFAACGDDDDTVTAFEVTVTEQSEKNFEIEAPAEVEAGAVEISLDNSGNEVPHAAAIIKVEDGRTTEEALEIIDGDEEPSEIPEWIRGYGGVGDTAPGETATATVLLDEGNYFVQDDADNGGEGTVLSEFTVTGDGEGELPETEATVTAAETGEGDEKYSWETDGLVAGENEITFISEGEEALHHIIAAPIKGDATIEDVRADLESDGPPKSVDFENVLSTPVIDGERSQTLTLDLEAGRYAFICFLPDRDTPEKSHYEQGLLDEVEIPAS